MCPGNTLTHRYLLSIKWEVETSSEQHLSGSCQMITLNNNRKTILNHMVLFLSSFGVCSPRHHQWLSNTLESGLAVSLVYAWFKFTVLHPLPAPRVRFHFLVFSTPHVFTLQFSVTVGISPCHEILPIAISLITDMIMGFSFHIWI